MKITKEMKVEMNKLYDAGGKPKDIATQFNVSKISVNTCLLNPRKQGNIPKVTEEMAKQFNALYYEDNKSANSIAKMFNVSHTTVDKYLNRGWQE